MHAYLDDFLRDLRLACRQILRRPRTSVLVVLCATLAIGLDASIFSLVSSVALFEPEAEDPDQLVRLYGTFPGFEYASLSYPNYADLRDADTALESLAAYSVEAANVSIDGEHERLATVLATGNYFSTLGVGAARGRVFDETDDRVRMGHPVAVIGDRLWRTRFGSDEQIIGREILINSEPFTVIGVTPPEWQGTFPGLVLDLWVPMQMQPLLQPARPDTLERRGWGWLMTAGRLEPGANLERAQASIDTQVAALRQAHPDQNEGWGVALHRGVVPFPPTIGAVLEKGSLAMMLLVGCVLLVACANVAGLLLARAEERQREIGIRLAIGADRGRLVRQLLVESSLLAAIGGVLGLGLAYAAAAVYPRMMPNLAGMPVTVTIEPDGTVLLFTLVLTLLTGLLFGLLPALQATRPDLVNVLEGESGTVAGQRRVPVRHLLVGFQVALSMVLLAVAGLFVTSLDRERDVDLGFATDGLLIAALDPSLHGYDQAGALGLFERLLERTSAMPGVLQAAYAETVPVGLIGNQQRGIEVEGYEPAEGERTNPEYNVISEGYFSTMGIRLEEGRELRAADDADAPPVVIVNRALADRYWPEGQALGGRLYTAGAWHEVIGIAANGKYQSRREAPQPHFYLSLRQTWEPSQQLHLRAEGDTRALVPVLRQALAELDPDVALYNVRTMDQHLEESMVLQKLGARLVALFGALALVLAAIGLFGLLTHAVVSRTREIGIRMSVGADAVDIFGRVVREGLGLVVLGLLAGLGGALAAGRLLESLLFGVSGLQASTYLAVAALLLATALVSIALPAWRATRVDPIVALRHH